MKEKYDSDIPSTIKDLCSLPGVGKKMAYLAMTCAWNKCEGIGVDVHVHRIANRLLWCGMEPAKTPEKTRVALESLISKDKWADVNHMLVGFGQTICKSKPLCESKCSMNKICPFYNKKITEMF